VYGAIGLALCKDADVENLNMAYSNTPESYYKRQTEALNNLGELKK